MVSQALPGVIPKCRQRSQPLTKQNMRPLQIQTKIQRIIEDVLEPFQVEYNLLGFYEKI